MVGMILSGFYLKHLYMLTHLHTLFYSLLEYMVGVQIFFTAQLHISTPTYQIMLHNKIEQLFIPTNKNKKTYKGNGHA
jgi:hypothetical protein